MSPTRATVDHDRCEGNMICEGQAPAVFMVGDDDLAEVLVKEITDDQREAVDRAVRLCPKQAIRLSTD
jgi:ferredoxin